MPFLQEIIHKLEVGVGIRYLRIGLGILALILLTVGYNWRAFRNMHNLEAMDAAQLGRNIAEGKGYTTLFIRPFSMYLVKKRTQQTQGLPALGTMADQAQIRKMHPDLANPPVYPVVLAGFLKVAHLDYAADQTHPFWSTLDVHGRRVFYRYRPDFLIGLLNQFFFFLSVAGLFLLARKLFDNSVAWMTAIFFLGNELFWRFSVSGLSTNLLMLIFLGLAWILVLLEEEVRVPRRGPSAPLLLATASGIIAGLGGLTRYSFGWVLIPLLVFLLVFGGPRRVVLAGTALVGFLAVMGPWVARNYVVSGTPFGTSTYTVLEGTYLFPEYRLQRSLEPNLAQGFLSAFWGKFNGNIRQILQNDLPKLGGSWATALFLAGLLVGFRNPALKRLRYFVVSCLAVFTIAQALGHTQLSEESPDINSENLIVLVTPFALMYGVSLFFILLDQINVPFPQLRYVIMGFFSIAACFPMVFVFTPPRTGPVAYPPYFPPAIQNIAGWLKESELIMSDIPWAVAWYGERQSVWLTLKATPDAKDPNTHEDFFAIYDYQKPINVLYLTPQTMDGRFLTQWIRAGEQSWGSFILESIVKKKVPDYFPLNITQSGWLPENLVLADWERWRKTNE